MRTSWDDYFMRIADTVSERSTCRRHLIGAVIVRDRVILSTGYNGAPRGIEHCSDVGCLRDELDIPSGHRHEICRAVHAEQNAIIQAAAYGIAIKGGTIYTKFYPCIICAKMIINAQLISVVYVEDYGDSQSKDHARIVLEKACVATIRIETGDIHAPKEGRGPGHPCNLPRHKGR